jgi:hypothetical protein
MSKQTAVEWIVNEFNKERLIDLNQKTTMYLIVQQAKAMEKEQIIDAVDGFPLQNRNLDGEQYYNETYKEII